MASFLAGDGAVPASFPLVGRPETDKYQKTSVRRVNPVFSSEAGQPMTQLPPLASTLHALNLWIGRTRMYVVTSLTSTYVLTRGGTPLIILFQNISIINVRKI